MEDLKIVKKIQDGNKSLFWELYEKYIDDIYKFIYLKTTNQEIAEDITSETFISALQNISSFDIEKDSSNFKAWIYKIAYNKVINFYKIKDREVQITDFLDIWFEENFCDTIDCKDKLRNILTYLSGLKKQEKEVIIYRVWHDLSFKEISEILDISLDNCKKISSRTMKKISANFLAILFIFLIF